MKNINMYLKTLFLIFAFMLSIFSSTSLAMESHSGIDEGQIYKIKNQSSGKCLSSSGAETGLGSTLMEVDVQDERTSYRLWYFEKEGAFCKIKNKNSGNCLSGGGSETGMTTTTLQGDVQDKLVTHRLWYFEKAGEFYKIKNKDSGSCLSSLGFETGNGTASMQGDIQDEFASHRLWYFEKVGEFCKTKNKDTGDCLNCGSETSNGAADMQRDVQDERAKDRILFDGGCCKGGCTTSVITSPTGQTTHVHHHAEDLNRYKLFGSSFVNGAAFSLVPEVFRDALESRGYPQASNIVAMIIQGGMIVYITSSYTPVVTGIAVRTGFNQLGFSNQSSAIAGSTASIAASLIQRLIVSHETVLDCVVDVAIGVAGSYSGSILALKAKSLIYDLWGRYKPGMVYKKAQ